MRPVIQTGRRRPLNDGIINDAKIGLIGAGVGLITGIGGTLIYQKMHRTGKGADASGQKGAKLIKGMKHLENDSWFDKKTFGISNKAITAVAALATTAVLVKPEVFKKYKYLTK